MQNQAKLLSKCLMTNISANRKPRNDDAFFMCFFLVWFGAKECKWGQGVSPPKRNELKCYKPYSPDALWGAKPAERSSDKGFVELRGSYIEEGSSTEIWVQRKLKVKIEGIN